MKSYLEKHHRVLGIIGGVIAGVVAVIYLKVIPEEAGGVSGLHKIILAYGHAVCWVLLSLAAFLWAAIKRNKWSQMLAYIALAVYALFIGTLFITTSM